MLYLLADEWEKKSVKGTHLSGETRITRVYRGENSIENGRVGYDPVALRYECVSCDIHTGDARSPAQFCTMFPIASTH